MLGLLRWLKASLGRSPWRRCPDGVACFQTRNLNLLSWWLQTGVGKYMRCQESKLRRWSKAEKSSGKGTAVTLKLNYKERLGPRHCFYSTHTLSQGLGYVYSDLALPLAVAWGEAAQTLLAGVLGCSAGLTECLEKDSSYSPFLKSGGNYSGAVQFCVVPNR